MKKQITVLDVGGGVANDYHSENDAVDFKTYTEEVLGQVPELKNYRIITEFGRSIFTKPGKVSTTRKMFQFVSCSKNDLGDRYYSFKIFEKHKSHRRI